MLSRYAEVRRITLSIFIFHCNLTSKLTPPLATMSNQAVALIIGAGPNIGHHVALALSKGYKVALASRSTKKDEEGLNRFHFQVDLVNPSSLPALFSDVKKVLGTPSVVIYNGKCVSTVTSAYTDLVLPASASIHNEPKSPFSISLPDFTRDLNINTVSAYAAAQQATLGFEQLPDSAARTFIYTGNIMNNNYVIGPLMTLGVGKSATAHLIQAAVAAYADKGFK